MRLGSKEQIKTQMVKTAARLWNIPEDEIDTSFDPLVMLLMEACAAEMEKIGFEIDQTHSRLLERFTEFLVPESLLGVAPASCVMTAAPVEPSAIVDTETCFGCDCHVQTKTKMAAPHFDFTPVGRFLLRKARLAYMVIGKNIYKIKENTTKELYYSTSVRGNAHLRKLYLVIDTEVQSLDGLSIYFDLRNHPRAEDFYSALRHAKLVVDGNDPVSAGVGYWHREQFDFNANQVLAGDVSRESKTNRSVAGVYAGYFVHLPQGSTIGGRVVPSEIVAGFPKEIMEKALFGKLVFVEIQFNRNFTEEELEGLSCCINAFPAINKQLHTHNYVTDKWVNVIPLRTDDHFFDLKNISSSNGNVSYERIQENDGLKNGQAMVRMSGVGKADSLSIRSLIGSLTHAVQEESNYFNEPNNELLMSKIDEMERILASLNEQMLQSDDLKKSAAYLLLKPRNVNETISIQYFTTSAELANQIPPYTALQPYKHLLTGIKDNYIISKVMGGKSDYTFAEQKDRLRHQMMSKDRIVSVQDVKLLFQKLYGRHLGGIEVRKGYAIGHGHAHGLKRTIEVALKLRDISIDDANYVKNEALDILNNNATVVYPFTVTIQVS
ncbi:MAG: hypothetical protein QM610_10125 [Chitinophagaceae bacterium]